MLKHYSKNNLLFILVVLFTTACKVYYPTQHDAQLIKANKVFQPDTAIEKYYQPYKDSLDKKMNIKLAELEEDLTKKMPESTLGNLLVDILKQKTAELTKNNIDVAVLNYGGIRVGSLNKGPLRVEDAYLIMPFDNYLVEQILTGSQLMGFCDSIALKNGWPISGMSFQIKDHKAINILVNNQPIQPEKKYAVALIDYVANGGDGIAFLKSIPQIQTGKLFRDAIIDYWTDQTKSGKKISAHLENRISYAE